MTIPMSTQQSASEKDAMSRLLRAKKVVKLMLSCPNQSIATQPTFQRRINVISTLWINVEITFIRRWKQNKIWRRIFNVVQRGYNVSARRWNNFAQRWNNVVSLLFERIRLNFSENYVGPNRARDGHKFVSRWIVFILLNDKIFLLTILLLLKYQKIYLCSMN